jgi:DNA-binding response OmpR family regulator
VALVLVVDDNPVVRDLAVYALEAAGMDVREAADGIEALQTLIDADVDAVVLDIMMPGLSGHEVLAALKEAKGGDTSVRPAVLMLTCKTDDEDGTKAFDLGAADFMTKPFDPAQLVHAVRAMLYTPLQAG